MIPGVISGRDEFEDIDALWEWKVPFQITRGEHRWVQPYYMRHPETEEEIRVNCKKIDYGDSNKLPFWIEF